MLLGDIVPGILVLEYLDLFNVSKVYLIPGWVPLNQHKV